jgi:hypothetical protein
MALVKKKVVSGFIKPRWSKAKVVKWLEIGAVPTILGLWIPDWVGGYAHVFQLDGRHRPIEFPFPPFLTYAGAVILIKACLEGIRDMGKHYKAARILGLLSIASALASVPLHFAATGPDLWFALELLSIGLAAFLGTGVLWITVVKVAEITMESRTRAAAGVILLLNAAALVAGAGAVLQILLGAAGWQVFLRIAVVLFTAAFVACRYAVHCYKTQKYIGTSFVSAPDEQYWV